MRKLVLSIAILLLSATLLMARAQWLSSLLPRYLPQLKYEQLGGSLWQGWAEQVSWRLGGGDLFLGQLRWSVPWRSLLLMDPVLLFKVEAEGQQLRGQLRAVPEGFLLQQAAGHFPLQAFEAWIPMLVSADVSFDLPHLYYRRGRLQALEGMLKAKRVSWEGGDYPMPLGSYQAELRLQQSDVLMLIGDQQALLAAAGEFRVNYSGDYRFQAVLAPRPGLAPEVARSIRWLGKRHADKSVSISRAGFWKK